MFAKIYSFLKKIDVKKWIILVIEAIVAIFLIVVIADIYYENKQISEDMNQLSLIQKNLNESIIRAGIDIIKNYADLERFAKNNDINLKLIQADTKTLNASLVALGVTIGKTKNVTIINQPSDTNGDNPQNPVPICPENNQPIDVWGYTKSPQTKFIFSAEKLRIADVTFDASTKTPWSYNVYGTRYKINSAIAQLRDGRFLLYSELLATSEADSDNTIRIPMEEAQTLQLIRPQARFRWFDPYLHLTAQLGLNAWPDLDISGSVNLMVTIMSYGSWRFLGLSAGYEFINKAFIISFVPTEYNIGDPIPLLDDLFLYPYVSVDHRGEVGVGLGLATTF